MGIFSLIMGLCFFAASFAFRLFAQTTSRQSLQRQARAIFSWLGQDLSLTNMVRCAHDAQNFGSDRRDSVAIVGMASWQAPIDVDSLKLPKWNSAIVYRATLDSPGRFLRQTLTPPHDQIPLQFPTVSTYLAASAGGTTPPGVAVEQRQLADSVQSFSIELNQSLDCAVITLSLTDKTVQATTGNRRTEALEVQTTVYPRNTWPRL